MQTEPMAFDLSSQNMTIKSAATIELLADPDRIHQVKLADMIDLLENLCTNRTRREIETMPLTDIEDVTQQLTQALKETFAPKNADSGSSPGAREEGAGLQDGPSR